MSQNLVYLELDRLSLTALTLGSSDRWFAVARPIVFGRTDSLSLVGGRLSQRNRIYDKIAIRSEDFIDQATLVQVCLVQRNVQYINTNSFSELSIQGSSEYEERAFLDICTTQRQKIFLAVSRFYRDLSEELVLHALCSSQQNRRFPQRTSDATQLTKKIKIGCAVRQRNRTFSFNAKQTHRLVDKLKVFRLCLNGTNRVLNYQMSGLRSVDDGLKYLSICKLQRPNTLQYISVINGPSMEIIIRPAGPPVLDRCHWDARTAEYQEGEMDYYIDLIDDDIPVSENVELNLKHADFDEHQITVTLEYFTEMS